MKESVKTLLQIIIICNIVILPVRRWVINGLGLASIVGRCVVRLPTSFFIYTRKLVSTALYEGLRKQLPEPIFLQICLTTF